MTVFVGAGAAQDPPGKEGVAMLTASALERGADGIVGRGARRRRSSRSAGVIDATGGHRCDRS